MSSTTDPALRIENLTKVFPNVRALTDVSLDVHAGKTLALMGENGAGKSTFLKILAGDYKSDGGSIYLNDHPMVVDSPADSRRLGLRVVHQEPDIVGSLSVAENVFLGEAPHNGSRFINWKKLNRDAEELLSTFRFGAQIDPAMPAELLTPAQRQMVEILRGLRKGLKVLALDEPTSSLSDAEAEDLFDVVARLKKQGVAIIYVSHRMNEILGLADRVAVLRDGHLVGVRPVAELDQKTLIGMMVGREMKVTERQKIERGEARLTVRNLCSPHVRGINLTVHAGEVVGIAGLVGAGRSELAKTLFGDLPHDSGEVLIDDQPVKISTPSDAVRAGLVYVPEERKAEGIFAERAVSENTSIVTLADFTRFRFLRRNAEEQAVAKATEAMRVKTPSLAQPIGKLSGGNQQKVILARWIMAKPKVMILDEPTRGIDVGAKAEIYKLISEMADEGRAVLVISSELPELFTVTDRILCMSEGQLVADLETANTNEEEVLHHCMIGHVSDVSTHLRQQ